MNRLQYLSRGLGYRPNNQLQAMKGGFVRQYNNQLMGRGFDLIYDQMNDKPIVTIDVETPINEDSIDMFEQLYNDRSSEEQQRKLQNLNKKIAERSDIRDKRIINHMKIIEQAREKIKKQSYLDKVVQQLDEDIIKPKQKKQNIKIVDEEPKHIVQKQIQIEKINKLIKDSKLEHYRSNDTQYFRTQLKKILLNLAKKGVELMKNSKSEDEKMKINKISKDLLKEYADLVKRGITYKIKNEEVVEVVTDSSKEYKDIQLNEKINITEAKKELDEYEKKNNLVLNLELAKEILDDLKISNSEIKKYKKLFKIIEQEKSEKDITEFINDEKFSRKYLKTLNYSDVEINKRVEESGKNLEFSICDYSDKISNQLAKLLFDIDEPAFIVSDFMVNEMGLLGSQFCYDNLDLENRIANEMKDYNTINYYSMYNLNVRYMIMYLDKMKDKIKKFKENGNFKELQNSKSIISNISDFEKSFYKNSNYLGVSMTANKIDNEMIIPDTITGPNTKQQLQLVKSECKQKFRPIMNQDKQITGITAEYIKGQKDRYEKMNKQMKKDFGFTNKKSSHLSLLFTVRFKDCIGVYDFTYDSNIDDGYVFNVYRSSFAHIQIKKKSYNSFLIPINKFILKKK